jgi:hypothetical protein
VEKPEPVKVGRATRAHTHGTTRAKAGECGERDGCEHARGTARFAVEVPPQLREAYVEQSA